jgi:hypothetical protein
MNTDYSIFLISNKKEYYETIKNSILPEKLEYFDGTTASSFSGLVNACVESCTTEIIIIMSDKVLPQQEHIQKILDLIHQGHGFVGLYRFGCFGFKKDLFRQIGMMDERFIGGGYEDDDFYIRLIESNISAYLSHEVPYTKRPSAWVVTKAGKDSAADFFTKKWGVIEDKLNTVYRRFPEETYNYNLGPSTNAMFLTWDKTVMSVKKLKKYTTLRISKENSDV